MSQLSQTLERLIEIISVEKLVGLVEKNINVLPKTEISQPNISQSNIIVKDYGNDIAKIQEQLASINSNLVVLSETIKNVIIGNVANPVANPVAKIEEEHIRLNIEEKVEICCLPTVEHIISEIVNVEDITDKDEEEEEEEEEEDAESEEEEEEDAESEEDVSDNKVEESDVSYNKVKTKEVVSEAVEEEEEEVEESESEPEVGVESEEEEVVEEEEVEESEIEIESKEDISDNKVESKEDEDEEEVFEIEIDDVTYYATHEENGILYAVDKDGDVGKQVGIIKDGEPIFS